MKYQLFSKTACIGLILGLFLILGCRTQPPTQIQKEEVLWIYKDSIVQRDSICYIPIERYVDIVPIYDTLVLENSIAVSHSWVDTTNHLLRGELKNKNAIQYKVKYVERVVNNDSLVYKEVPKPYPVEIVKTHIPSWAWICLAFSTLVILFIIWKIYKRSIL